MKPLANILKWSALGTAALALAACATLSPEEQSAYSQAQTEVQRLEADSLANQAAGKPLQEARDALSNADMAATHHDGAEVTYWSYMATRHAQVGEAMVSELRVRNAVADSTRERDRVLLESERRRTEVAQLQAQQAAQQAQAAQQELQQQRQREQEQQAQQQIAQAQQQAQQQVQEAQQQEEALKQQLEQMRAAQTIRGMVLTLSGSLLFATGGDTLEPGAIHSLDNVAQLLQQHPTMKARIEGFTDSRGSDELNDALSQRRAEAVLKALESAGVDASRLDAIGRGKSLPLASNNTDAGRQQNRRVELVFSDIEGRFASATNGEPLR